MSTDSQNPHVRELAEAINALGKELLCPICLSFLTIPVRLACNHYFCKNCIDLYFCQHNRCPVCKTIHSSRNYVEASRVSSIVAAYQTLANPTSTHLTLSQPVSTERQIYTLLGNDPEEFLESPTKLRVVEMARSLSQVREQQIKKDRASFVWLVTGLTAPEKKLVNHVCTHSSVRVVNEYTAEVTHCIAATTRRNEQFLTRRTMKYCIAVLQHIPIVSVEWVREIAGVIDAIIQEKRDRHEGGEDVFSLPLEEFPSYEEYWVVGDEQARHLLAGGPRRSLEQSDGMLFAGLQIEVQGEFKPPLPSRSAIEDLIHRGGGIVRRNDVEKGVKNDDENDENVMVVVDVGKKEGIRKGVTYYWLLDCISNYQIEDQTDYQCFV